MSKPNPTMVLIVVVTMIAAGVTGYWLGTGSPDAGMPHAPAAAEKAEPEKPLFWRNPMNAEITSPVPAKDHMGMDYIPVYAETDDDARSSPPGTVRIDPVTTQSIGVRTARAERRTLSRDILTVGRVDYDEQRILRLHPKTEGWIEELFIDTTGQAIDADEILLSIYSPQLVSTQQEYLLAIDNLETLGNSPYDDVRNGAQRLVSNALDRLELFDVPAHQIAELQRTRKVKKQLHIHSPGQGIVINVGAREGQFVTPQTELYLIADLTRVWVYVDIFEDELPWVAVGDTAVMQVAGAPGRKFTGRLTYIYPYAERRTRTIKARVELDNSELLLRPDMFANVVIQASPEADVVAVPTEAVVRSGVREKVFVVTEPGKFEPRDVVVGVHSEGWIEVSSGVAAGEEIVVSAQFLIDSESKLREAAAKMRALPE